MELTDECTCDGLARFCIEMPWAAFFHQAHEPLPAALKKSAYVLDTCTLADKLRLLYAVHPACTLHKSLLHSRNLSSFPAQMPASGLCMC